MLHTPLCPDPWLQAANDPYPGSTPQAVMDQQFVQMLDIFRPSGGLASIPELRHALQAVGGAQHNALDGWIRARSVICFEWQTRSWLPWFQFNRKTLVPHAPLQRVLAELNAVHEPWDVACWFAQANPSLQGHAPVDCLLSDLRGVLHAACVDSVIANGRSG